MSKRRIVLAAVVTAASALSAGPATAQERLPCPAYAVSAPVALLHIRGAAERDRNHNGQVCTNQQPGSHAIVAIADDRR
jgi:hypothetical protein